MSLLPRKNGYTLRPDSRRADGTSLEMAIYYFRTLVLPASVDNLLPVGRTVDRMRATNTEENPVNPDTESKK